VESHAACMFSMKCFHIFDRFVFTNSWNMYIFCSLCNDAKCVRKIESLNSGLLFLVD